MNFGEALLRDRSKEHMQYMAEHLIRHPEDLSEFMQLLDLSNTSESQYRAAWVLGYLSPMGSEAFVPYLEHLIQLLDTSGVHPTITRSITRLFQYIMLPEAYHGKLIDTCFNILSSEEQLSAQRANSMTILHRYTQLYPELSQELQLVISEILEYKKDPALQSRGQKILKLLRKNHEPNIQKIV